MDEEAIKKLSQAGVNRASTPGPGVTDYQNKLIKTGGKAIAGANMFIAATSLMDFAVSAKRAKETRAQTKEQEKNVKKREKKQREARKRMEKRDSMNRLNPGEVVFDMFAERTGHHKMGNSRF